MSDEKRKFYAGVRPDCGCYTALLVDDEKTTAKDVARFAADMAKSKRVVRHVELTHDECMATFRNCPHMTPNAEQARRRKTLNNTATLPGVPLERRVGRQNVTTE